METKNKSLKQDFRPNFQNKIIEKLNDIEYTESNSENYSLYLSLKQRARKSYLRIKTLSSKMCN